MNEATIVWKTFWHPYHTKGMRLGEPVEVGSGPSGRRLWHPDKRNPRLASCHIENSHQAGGLGSTEDSAYSAS